MPCVAHGQWCAVSRPAIKARCLSGSAGRYPTKHRRHAFWNRRRCRRWHWHSLPDSHLLIGTGNNGTAYRVARHAKRPVRFARVCEEYCAVGRHARGGTKHRYQKRAVVAPSILTRPGAVGKVQPWTRWRGESRVAIGALLPNIGCNNNDENRPRYRVRRILYRARRTARRR